VPFEEPPDCSPAALDPLLVHCRDDLVQRQIRILRHQCEQPLRMSFQRRSAPTARFRCCTSGRDKALNPSHRRTDAYLENLCRLSSGGAALDGLDHSLSPPQKRKGRGRPRIKGKRLPKLSSLLKSRRVSWQRLRISRWYGQTNRLIEVATGTALWYRAGIAPVPIRWIIVRDPKGSLDPQAFLCTDLNASPRDIIAWFVSRWNVEVTFQEVRAHLGVETQRQWSDNAILRTTPALLALYSIIALLSHDISKQRKIKPRTAAWYTKNVLTFSDAIAAVRREIWLQQISFMSRPHQDTVKIPRHIWNRLEAALAYAA